MRAAGKEKKTGTDKNFIDDIRCGVVYWKSLTAQRKQHRRCAAVDGKLRYVFCFVPE